MKIVLFTEFQNLKRFQHGVEKTEVNPGADVTPPWPILDGTTVSLVHFKKKKKSKVSDVRQAWSNVGHWKINRVHDRI